MRISGVLALGLMACVLFLAGQPAKVMCAVSISIVDETGQALPGLIAVNDADGNEVPLSELLSRGQGLDQDPAVNRWSVLAGATRIQVPRARLTLVALAGLEREQATLTRDFTGQATADVRLTCRRFHAPQTAGWRSGNTHLHLMKLTRAQCDRYLSDVPRADGLELVFLSYLERADADREYISNRYTTADLAALSTRSGTLFGNGEEHRHNFTGFNEGYGHVMLLDIQRLIQPVSIGPGIMLMGTDGLPLQRGIDQAHRDGATALWCHNSWGVERIPNWVLGKLDAQNIFDGGIHGSYRHSFYRYLNAGLKVPFSTGTDWFMYDFSRVYAHVEGPLTTANWLAALRKGRSYITNGPFLELTVGGKSLGDTLELTAAGDVAIQARALGRVDFGRIELIRNGEVVATAASRPVEGHFEALLSVSAAQADPAWLALRTPPPPVKDDPELQTAVPLNELGKPLFAHTSPVYVTLGGRSVFDRQEARRLLADMETNVETISRVALFADEQERARVLDVHREGISVLRSRLESP